MNGGMNANAERMSLRRKIGQLLMCGFEGTEPSASIVRLIREYGLGRVALTDCLEMNAISETVGVGRGVVEAVKGGADLVLVSHRPDRQLAALESLHEAVLAGDIPEARIDEAVRRVMRLKEKRGLLDGRRPAAPDPAAARLVARRICESAVTVVRGGDRLPLSRDGRLLVVWAEARVGTEVVEAIRQTWTLADALREEGYSVAEVRVGTHPSGQESSAAMTAASVADAVVFASYDTAFPGGQTRLIADLNRRAADGGQTFVLVATRSPYDLRNVPDVPVYVCAYENKPAMVAAAAGVLSGRLHGRGRLPVPIGI